MKRKHLIAWGLAAVYQNYPQVFSDLTDMNIDFDQYVDAKVSISTIDGRHYGVPFDTGTSIFAVRTDYLEQAGHTVEDVTDVTWDEFIEVGKDVLEATGYRRLCQKGALRTLWKILL